MIYIIRGFLFGIGLYLAKLIFGIVEELLFSRLHKAKWYNIILGEQQDIENVKKIGF